jgi:hypothetical protein
MAFGVSASSFPNTSWMNVTEPISSAGRFSGSANKGGSMFGPLSPLTAGLGFASAGIGALAGFGAERRLSETANAQAQAAADQLKWNIQQGRDIAKFGEGGNVGARVAQGTWMPDLDLGRQLYAKKFELGPLAEMESATLSDRARRGVALASSLEAREQSQRENRAALNRSLAEKEAVMAGMFGPIARPNLSTTFV